jgi:hypothetical protein
MRALRRIACSALAVAIISVPAFAQRGAAPQLHPQVGNAQAPLKNDAESARRDAENIAFFERKATLAKELGATFVSISEEVPPAMWQFDPPDDPYPAWFINRPSLLKVFPPKEVQPYVDMAYAERIAKIFEQRCQVLRKLGLKASWNSNEPQTLPEKFFTAFPQLRGARVDQPNRSRAAWWAPCVDEPQTLEFYKAAVKNMLQRCPEIESMGFLTSDSGSGFCWVPGLYPGINGNSNCKNRPMEQRVSGFLIALQSAAKEAGHDLTININPIGPRQWMTPSFSAETLNAIVRLLPRGLSISGREGPDGRAFGGGVAGGGNGFGGGGAGAFSPVVGLVIPSTAAGGGGGGRGGGGAARGGGRGARAGRGAPQPTDEGDLAQLPPATAPTSYPPRILVNLGDENTIDFNYRMTKASRGMQARNWIERLTNLRTFAASEVGENNADVLLETWNSLNGAEQNLNALNFGGMLRFGHVLNRWITRPMVPFPMELTPAEKADWRPFLFQAKDEEQAMDLVDIQAMRMYEGWGAKMLFQRVIETTAPQVSSAARRIERMTPGIQDEKVRRYWELYAKRLDAAYCLLESADHMVSYQAHLDRIHQMDIKPDPNPPLGQGSDWARSDMMELARKEIDTMINLRQILTSTKEPIIETADYPEEETIMMLGPNLADQIKHKIDIMNAHWRDYDRIFTVPNP